MPSTDQDAFYLLTTRFLSGESATEERERLREFRQNPACDALFMELQRRWEAAQPSPAGDFDVKTALKRLADAIRESPDFPPTRRS